MIFCPNATCELVWLEARTLYTNDAQCLYIVYQELMTVVAPQRFDGLMFAYLGRLHTAFHDYNELFPPAATKPEEAKKELENRSTFFMTFALFGLPPEYSATCDQILGSPALPTMTRTSSALL